MTEFILEITEEIPVAAAAPIPADKTPMPEDALASDQAAIDLIEEASMESFPCSDPPGYTMSHS